jgi:hypothetical protein
MVEVKSLPPVLGVAQKPATCKSLCPYCSVGSGYVEDWAGKDPKVAFLIPSPTGDDCLNRMPMTGKGGNSFIRKYIEPLGYTRDNCIFSHVLRCRPKGDGSKKARYGQYPTGSARKGSEAACRYYDRFSPLAKFAPDCYLITFELTSLYTEPAFTRLFAVDIRKAFELSTRGFRPLVLLGNPTAELVAPYVNGNGGVKEWHSHWEEMPEGWPWLSGTQEIKGTTRGFRAA